MVVVYPSVLVDWLIFKPKTNGHNSYLSVFLIYALLQINIEEP